MTSTDVTPSQAGLYWNVAVDAPPVPALVVAVVAVVPLTVVTPVVPDPPDPAVVVLEPALEHAASVETRASEREAFKARDRIIGAPWTKLVPRQRSKADAERHFPRMCALHRAPIVNRELTLSTGG
jgi:hypothetical protein